MTASVPRNQQDPVVWDGLGWFSRKAERAVRPVFAARDARAAEGLGFLFFLFVLVFFGPDKFEVKLRRRP